MRILGLDFGSKTVGLAVSDELLLTAQGLEIIRRQSLINYARLWRGSKRLSRNIRWSVLFWVIRKI